ncbi:hypothetical protein ES705_03260 [subsurface metagenome]
MTTTGASTVFHHDLLKQIGLGINLSRTYPKGHPALLPIVKRFRILLKEVPIEQDSFSLVVIEDVIMIEQERFDSKILPIVKTLVDRLTRLGVKSITFNIDLSEEDIREFFTAMAATPSDIADYGDIVALIKARGVSGIKVNKYRVGVISTDEESQAMNWEQFLESLAITQPAMNEEERIKELGNFLAGIGVAGSEPANIQTGKIVAGLEKLALLVADQYGEDRWNEYSLVFSRMLSVLSPVIKKNIIKYRTGNKKLAVLFRNLIPTMVDEDIIDIISMKAKERSPTAEQEIVDILKNVTGARLPDLLSTLRISVPDLNFEKIVARLMGELKSSKGEKAVDKLLSKDLEIQMRAVFPRLRDKSHEKRIKAVDELMSFSDKIFEAENYDLIKLLADRLDTMADAETAIRTFKRVIAALKTLHLKARGLKKHDIVQFISKKFGKHLLRKDAALLERKRILIEAISEVKDENYVPELISLLWDPGTFVEARAALTSLSEFSVPLLIDTLKDTEDRSVRMKIIDVLIKIGDKAIPKIEKILSSSEWYIRRNGIFILGEMKAVSAVNAIGKLIDDEEEQVQLAVIASLRKIGGDKVRDYIKTAMDSKYRQVAIRAMQSLEKDDVREKLSDVVLWLKSHKGIPDKEEEKFRRGVIGIIGKFGDDSVIGQLVEVLNEKTLFKGSLLQPTKVSALNALVKIGSEEAIKALHDATNHKDQFVATTAQDILRGYEAK